MTFSSGFASRLSAGSAASPNHGTLSSPILASYETITAAPNRILYSSSQPSITIPLTAQIKLHISSLDREGKSQIHEFAMSLNNRRHRTVSAPFTHLDIVCMQDGDSVYICNPATEELVALPQKCSRNHCNYFGSKVGFGYLPSTKEYKVFRQIIPRGELACYELLTVGNDSHWKEVENPPFSDLRTPVFANGAFHILSEYECSIARFDLEQKEWSASHLPNEIYQESVNNWSLMLRQINGLLCIADHGLDDHINLWFLKDYDKGIWAKEYWIDYPSQPSRFVPLSVEADGRILMGETSGRKLQYYDPATKSFQEIPTGKCNVDMNISYYVERFTPLRGSIM